MSGWIVRLTDQATQDVEDILDWTLAQFGTRQLEIYTDAINDAKLGVRSCNHSSSGLPRHSRRTYVRVGGDGD